MMQVNKEPTGRVKCTDVCAETNKDVCTGTCADVTAGESVSAPEHACEGMRYQVHQMSIQESILASNQSQQSLHTFARIASLLFLYEPHQEEVRALLQVIAAQDVYTLTEELWFFDAGCVRDSSHAGSAARAEDAPRAEHVAPCASSTPNAPSSLPAPCTASASCIASTPSASCSPCAPNAPNAPFALPAPCALRDMQKRIEDLQEAARYALEHNNESVWEYRRLFVGPAHKAAPPWGSVYTDYQEVMFGEATLKLRAWMRSRGITQTQCDNMPDDHIGLLIALLDYLLPERLDCALELLQFHLLPWCGHFFGILERETTHPLYRTLARFCNAYLNNVWYITQLSVVIPHFYRV